jgi:hypothetical protein
MLVLAHTSMNSLGRYGRMTAKSVAVDLEGANLLESI